jgi:hypothetical protein
MSTNLICLGSLPVRENAAVGKPDSERVNEFALPVANNAELAEVITGTDPTISVKLCDALGRCPFVAPKVIA